MIPTKVISGMQTGADQAGLYAARIYGIQTGGWATKGFNTENGPNKKFGLKYGLIEHNSEKYPGRTFANVKDSTGTIRFAYDFTTGGEILTLRAINQYNRPHIDININSPLPEVEVVRWIKSNNILTLNVAGNRESTWPGMFDFVSNYLITVFVMCRNCS